MRVFSCKARTQIHPRQLNRAGPHFIWPTCQIGGLHLGGPLAVARCGPCMHHIRAASQPTVRSAVPVDQICFGTGGPNACSEYVGHLRLTHRQWTSRAASARYLAVRRSACPAFGLPGVRPARRSACPAFGLSGVRPLAKYLILISFSFGHKINFGAPLLETYLVTCVSATDLSY